MIGLTVFVAWVLLATVTGTITGRRWFDKLDDESDEDIAPIIFGLFVVSILWPITLTVYITKGIVNAPERRRQKSAEKRNLARQAELDQAKHETALARERAAQAEAQNREYKAHGIPRVPGT